MRSAWPTKLLFGVAGAALILTVYCQLRLDRIPEMPCTETPKWDSTGLLRIRMDSSGSDTLLVQLAVRPRDREHLPPNPDQDLDAIYRRRPGQSGFDATDSGAWKQAEGDIGECFPRSLEGPTNSRVGVDEDFVLRFGDRVIKTAGKGVVTTALSPNDEIAAVVSSEVSQTRGMLFHGRASGQFYQQFFRVRDGIQVGETLRLPKLSSGPDQVLKSCWSPDTRYLIYSDEYHSHLCLVAAPESGKH
jgi:hypothetical protein